MGMSKPTYDQFMKTQGSGFRSASDAGSVVIEGLKDPEDPCNRITTPLSPIDPDAKRFRLQNNKK